ncbi:hypothetical protein BDA96_02G034800 [Sorghum bicolor]|uniref:Uncharacterized protein n=1 Tax=Sorghum bicolor TaxID=4558 RepID=A0A921UU20_SORBI|nr:hypothetical protein BDA96_02G034800 [Sorghum bicolor]
MRGERRRLAEGATPRLPSRLPSGPDATRPRFPPLPVPPILPPIPTPPASLTSPIDTQLPFSSSPPLPDPPPPPSPATITLSPPADPLPSHAAARSGCTDTPVSERASRARRGLMRHRQQGEEHQELFVQWRPCDKKRS